MSPQRRRRLAFAVAGWSVTFVLIASLSISAVLGIFLPGHGTVWDVANELISLVVFTSLFAALFKYLPDARLSWRNTYAGASITALLFTAGKFAIGQYLAHSGVGGAYGPAGSFVVLLVWVFYSASIFLFGAEVVHTLLGMEKALHAVDSASAVAMYSK